MRKQAIFHCLNLFGEISPVNVYNSCDGPRAKDTPTVGLTIPQIRVLYPLPFVRITWKKFFGSAKMSKQIFAAIILLATLLPIYAKTTSTYV